MQFQLLSFVLFAAFVSLVSSSNVCIGGLCPGGFTCVRSVCVKNGGPGNSENCRDKNPTECANKAYLCKNAQYNDNSQFNVMKDQCPKTCGYCR
ncbi:hypothetical protein L596_019909 [Steinernema carpocapsae]|uniref:ShKT domain-containing protein n=1 Tax=Steinernema carpocapsae TaxID=34508 RepID=A0A4U5MSK2_STECR|nr:hypothetical protein L596_019909 [Steinernema carpocapsae]